MSAFRLRLDMYDASNHDVMLIKQTRYLILSFLVDLSLLTP